MMNRILKRPMFRMGGRSDDGIMSLRPGYQEGDQVKEPGYFEKSGLGGSLSGSGESSSLGNKPISFETSIASG